jgi:hypothetical protein
VSISGGGSVECRAICSREVAGRIERYTAPKIGATIALLALLGIGTVGCSAPDTSGSSSTAGTKQNTTQVKEKPKPVSLDGQWKQNNPASPNSWQAATITGDTIEIYWVSNNGDTKSLYWAGSVAVPAEGDSFTFDSINDTSKTESSMLASSDPIKKFTYKDDQLSYEASALGTTTTVRLSRE